MATYYSSSSSERDVMPTIYPRNSLVSYPEDEVLPANMMMYLNQTTSTTSYADSVPGDYQLQLNHGELSSTRDSHSIPGSQGNLSDLIGSHVRELPYDVWRDGRNEVSFMQPMSGSATMESIGKQIDNDSNLAHSSVGEDPHTGLSPRMENLGRGKNLRGQGLSLSLSSQIPTAVPVSLFNYDSPNLGFSSFFNSYPSTSGGGTNEAARDNEIGRSVQSGNVYFPHGFLRENHNVIKGETDLRYVHSNRLSGLSSIIPKSKYLKMAQELLDEVVDVRKDLKQETDKNQSFRFGSRVSKDGEATEECGLLPKTKTLRSSEESNTNTAGELSPANVQNLQEKITELTSMLDEVDRRYKQYYHQMQVVASHFDGVAGRGASKPYTTLALHTISCHFRRIRDAISGQIKTVQSSLGEDDNAGKTKEGGISRLRFVEQKLRQHRALQQLGMMQQHAWRPQRGLPETSVTILRAWLFEHFLHPYPKDSDKIMLARQTGLTRGQVSNWFINARVRLWKPMIEDMYKEEIGDSEIDSNSSSDNTPKIASSSIKVPEDFGKESPENKCSATTGKVHSDLLIGSNAEFTHNMEGHTSINCFRDEGHEEELGANYGGTKLMGDQQSDMLNYRPFQSDGNADGRYIVASAAYQMAEVEMFGSQGGISLTLGLQHFEGTIPDPNHHNFVTVQGDDIYNVNASSAEPNNADGDCMDPDNQQYRFGTTHLLHDFVA